MDIFIFLYFFFFSSFFPSVLLFSVVVVVLLCVFCLLCVLLLCVLLLCVCLCVNINNHLTLTFHFLSFFPFLSIKGTHVLLEAAKEHGVQRFIHVSTDEVYGEGVQNEEHAMLEESVLEPTNPYAATKAAAEFLVKAYHRSFQLPVIITRGNNVYGPHQFPEKLIPKFIHQLYAKEKLTIHGTGENRRNYLHVSDVANAFDAILHRGVIGSIYNIGGTNELTNLDVALKLINTMKKIQKEKEKKKEKRKGKENKKDEEESKGEEQLEEQGREVKTKDLEVALAALLDPTVTKLNVSSMWNTWSEKIAEGVEKIAEGLQHENCRVTNLFLDGNNIYMRTSLVRALQHKNCRVTNLYLSNNRIDDEGVEHLSHALQHENCRVTHLNLKGNEIGAEGVEHLSHALQHENCRVTDLDLSENEIGDEGVEHLSHALQYENCRVTDLVLNYNEIGAKGVEHLSHALQHENCRVTFLALATNEIGDEGAEHLSRALQHENCRVTTLWLTPTGTDDRLQTFLDANIKRAAEKSLASLASQQEETKGEEEELEELEEREELEEQVRVSGEGSGGEGSGGGGQGGSGGGDGGQLQRGEADKYLSFVEDRCFNDVRYNINSSRLRNELGWNEQMTWEKGIIQTVRWYLETNSDDGELIESMLNIG